MRGEERTLNVALLFPPSPLRLPPFTIGTAT
jgi:hypothetical protein